MASFINAQDDLLNLLFTVPQKFDGKRAPMDNAGFSIPQQLACLGRLAGHERMVIVIDDIHVARHGFKPSLRSMVPLAIVQ